MLYVQKHDLVGRTYYCAHTYIHVFTYKISIHDGLEDASEDVERKKAMFICQTIPQRVSIQDSKRWIFITTNKEIVLLIRKSFYTEQKVWKPEAMYHLLWMMIFCFMTIQLFEFLHSIWKLSYLPFSSILDRLLSSQLLCLQLHRTELF